MALSTAILIGLAGTAHAEAAMPADRSTTSTAAGSGPVVLANFDDNVNLSTQAWAPTTLCVSNLGRQYGLLRLQQLRPGGTAEFIEVQATTTTCIERWWSGVDVNAMNVSSSPLSVATS
ncbi:hypothetical protein KRMM14A1259_68760 [Krasilnikovia sp. MM14-A1259]